MSLIHDYLKSTEKSQGQNEMGAVPPVLLSGSHRRKSPLPLILAMSLLVPTVMVGTYVLYKRSGNSAPIQVAEVQPQAVLPAPLEARNEPRTEQELQGLEPARIAEKKHPLQTADQQEQERKRAQPILAAHVPQAKGKEVSLGKDTVQQQPVAQTVIPQATVTPPVATEQNAELLSAILAELKNINLEPETRYATQALASQVNELNVAGRQTELISSPQQHSEEVEEQKVKAVNSYVAVKSRPKSEPTPVPVVREALAKEPEALPVVKNGPPQDPMDQALDEEGLMTRHYQAAMLAQKEGRLQSAEKYYLGILQQRPVFQETRVNLSAIYLNQEKLEKAEEVLQKLLEHDPNNSKALVNMGMIALKRQDFDKAQNLFEQALEKNSQEEDALINLSLLAAKSGDRDRQEYYLQGALALGTDNREAFLAYASLLEESSRFEEAVQQYHLCLKIPEVQADNKLSSQIRTRIRLLRQMN